MYEFFDEFEECGSREEKKKFLRDRNSKYLQDVLKLTFDPQYQFFYKEIPEEYKIPDSVPGIRYSGLDRELRKLYMFQIGNPTAENLGEKRRKELFLQLAESIEPREMEVLMGIMKKDLGVSELDVQMVREIFPLLLTNP